MTDLSDCPPILDGSDAGTAQGIVESVCEQADLGHGRILGFQRRDIPGAVSFEKQQPAQIEQPAAQACGQWPGLAQTIADQVDEPGAAPIGQQDGGMAERGVVIREIRAQCQFAGRYSADIRAGLNPRCDTLRASIVVVSVRGSSRGQQDGGGPVWAIAASRASIQGTESSGW
ncbi:MAG: hypothetical protein M5U35_11680 [Roseovarius sp.]|nr:hypothetical protein [Roseovarius sp.]